MGAADPGCQPAWLGRGTDGRRVLFLSFQDLGRRSLELTGSLVGADCACPCCLSGPAQPPRTPQPTSHLFCIWLVPTGSPSPRQALGLVQHMLEAPETLQPMMVTAFPRKPQPAASSLPAWGAGGAALAQAGGTQAGVRVSARVRARGVRVLRGREEAHVWTCAVAVLLSAWGFRTGSLPSQHQPCSVRGQSWPPTPSPPRQGPRASWQTPDG